MSYKRLFAGIALLAFFVPSVSFAQTPKATTYSPQYVAILQQLIKLLEEELAAIQTAAPSTASTTVTTANSTTVTSTASSTPVHGVYTTIDTRTGVETHWNADGTNTITCATHTSGAGTLIYNAACPLPDPGTFGG
jgi:hypothetical protein